MNPQEGPFRDLRESSGALGASMSAPGIPFAELSTDLDQVLDSFLDHLGTLLDPPFRRASGDPPWLIVGVIADAAGTSKVLRSL